MEDHEAGCLRVGRPADVAVVVVDLAGFTALTEIHGDHVAAELAEDFADLARSVLADGDRLDKTLGDGLLITTPSGRSALQLLVRLADALPSTRRFPALRAGIHFGPVVRSVTDVYGTTVNMAARIAALAQPGQVVVTGLVADAARRAGWSAQSLGPVKLRNLVEPVELFAVTTLLHSAGERVDPVCRMRVAERGAGSRYRSRDRRVWFCSPECRALFANYPERFAP
jgi:class 3 adenylate cyclase/YHS domain-containing protein